MTSVLLRGVHREAPGFCAGAARAAADRLACRLHPLGRPGPLRRAGRRRGRKVELRATDMEVGLRVPLQAEIQREGTAVLPARLTLDVVRALPAPTRSPSSCAPPSRTSRSSRAPRRSTSARCAARTSRRSPTPAATPSSPCRPRRSSPRSARSPARPRATRRGRSSPASSSRPPGRELRMVATDSYRLSVKETPLDADARRRLRGQRAGPRAAGARADRPGRRRRHAARGAPREPDRLRGRRRSSSSSRLIEGQFPNYRQLLPETYEHELRLE